MRRSHRIPLIAAAAAFAVVAIAWFGGAGILWATASDANERLDLVGVAPSGTRGDVGEPAFDYPPRPAGVTFASGADVQVDRSADGADRAADPELGLGLGIDGNRATEAQPDRAAGTDVDGGATRGAGSSPRARPSLRVLAPEVHPGTSTTAVRGFDPLGASALTLWKTDGRDHVRVAETFAGGDGRFDFGSIPIPTRGLDIVVTRADEDPETAESTQRRRLEPAEIAAPLARPLARPLDFAGARRDLLIQPVRLEGRLTLRDGGGRILDSVDLDLLPATLRHEVLLSLALPFENSPSGTDDGAVYLVHRLADGRRSREIVILLEGVQATDRPQTGID